LTFFAQKKTLQKLSLLRKAPAPAHTAASKQMLERMSFKKIMCCEKMVNIRVDQMGAI